MRSGYLALAGVVIALDQLSKEAIRWRLDFGESIPITRFFNLVLIQNPGAAFSFLSNASGWQREFFIAVALAASIWIIYLLWRHPERGLFGLALSLILGGALGNVIDRLRFGAVVDFLDFHIGGYHWPAFNLADSAITCGAALLIWDAFHSSSAVRKGTI
jgi:signal peptidase II